MMSNYAFFSKDLGCWGKSYQSLWGCYDMCPLLEWFHITHMTQSELAALTHLKVWGDAKKFHSDVTFLLVLPTEVAAEERVYGLSMVLMHPYQARVSTIDDAAKQLTQLTSTGPNWPCALVWLSGDTHHVPLPTAGLPECHDGGEYQQCPLQEDLPIGGLPTSELRLLGGLPRRTQWVSSSSDNVSA